MWYDITDELGVTLTPGTTYKYNFYAIINGKEYWSPVGTFTTEGHTHRYTSTVTNPTCTAQGYTTHTCSCGDWYRDNFTNALGHSYGAWEQNKAPTCTAQGTEKRTCTRCNATQTRNVELGHNYSNGKCTRCGAADPKYVSAPTLKITTVSGHPKIYWNSVSGATKYWIYRSTDGKNFKYFDSTTKTSYTNSGAASGTKYYYRVKAVAVVNGKNVVSANSSTKSLFTSLAKPSVSITTSNGKPKVTWKAVTGADKYYVYRSTDGKNFSYWDSTTKTSYINSGAKKNTKYYYKVKAVCASNSNANSAQSSAVSIKATK